jgi:hypothetical protein
MYAIKAAKRQAKGIADRDRMLKEVRQDVRAGEMISFLFA